MKISLIILILTMSCSSFDNRMKVEAQALENISMIDESIDVDYDKSFKDPELNKYLLDALKNRSKMLKEEKQVFGIQKIKITKYDAFLILALSTFCLEDKDSLIAIATERIKELDNTWKIEVIGTLAINLSGKKISKLEYPLNKKTILKKLESECTLNLKTPALFQIQ